MNEFERWTSEPLRPPEPRRLRNVLYGFAIFAEKQEIERAGAMAGGAAAMAGAG